MEEAGGTFHKQNKSSQQNNATLQSCCGVFWCIKEKHELNLVSRLRLLPLHDLKLLLIIGAHVTTAAQLPPCVLQLFARPTHTKLQTVYHFLYNNLPLYYQR